jgi:hypothetical protein
MDILHLISQVHLPSSGLSNICSFYQKTGLQDKEDTGKVILLECGFV